MLRHRLISAAVGLPAAVFVTYLGGVAFAATVCIIAMIAAHEIMMAIRRANIEPIKEVAFPCIAVGLVGTYAFVNGFESLFFLWCAVAFTSVFGSMAFHIFVRQCSGHLGERMASIGATTFVMAYVSMFAFMILLREGINGRELMLMALLTAWGVDAVAYFVGSKFGGRKICEHVSPGKTVLGSAVGALVALFIAPTISIAMRYIPEFAVGTPNPIEAIPIGLIAGTFGQLGDFCKSVIKRDLGIKDFSSLIPGHGGIVDRFDSLLISVPLIYFYAAAIR